MKAPNRASLTIERLSKLQKGETLWDTGVHGLCARRRTADAVTFYVKYRTETRRVRWFKIGKWGAPWLPHDARTEARKLLGAVSGGQDPQGSRQSRRRGVTVTDLLTAYIDTIGKAKRLKPSTLAEYRRLRDTTVAPAIGVHKAAALTREDVESFHKRTLGDRPYLANRAVALLRAAFNKTAPDLVNPTRGITLHLELARERSLAGEEVRALGNAMRDPEVQAREGVHAIAAIAFTLVTGRRKSEVLRLQWGHLTEIDGVPMMALHDHKASRLKGTVFFALPAPAVRLLEALPRIEGNPYVFPSAVREGAHIVAIDETWKRLCKAAGLDGLRIHDMRRTYASHGPAVGVDIFSTSKMLGHSSVRVTERHYAKLEAQKLRPAADKISGGLAGLLNGKP